MKRNKAILLLKEHFLFFIGLIVSIIILSTRINADFWNDELYTLENFILVPITTTITDYHVPNNHVFFNLVCNLYLKLIGIQNLSTLLDAPYILRSITFLFALVTIIYSYQITSKFFSKNTGILTIVLLITTIPYFNFSLLIRGYGLSAMLGVLCIFHCLKFIHHQNKLNLIYTGLFTFLLFYTLPSNLYFILGLAFYLLLYWGLELKATTKPFSLSNKYVQLLITVMIGTCCSLIAYSNIFSEVFMNSYLDTIPAFSFSQLRAYVPTMAHDMTSYRFLIPLIMTLGFVITLIKKRKLEHQVILFIILSTTPFFMYYAHGDPAPLRTFVIYIPSFIFIFAIGTGFLLETILQSPIKQTLVTISVSLYCFWAFYTELDFNSQLIQTDITQAVKKTSMFYSSYFSMHYQPLKDIRRFKTTYYDHKSPVVILGCEPHGVRHYLNHFNISYHLEKELPQLISIHDSVYIITNHFGKCPQNNLHQSIKLDSSYTYHNSVLCTHK